MKWDQFKGKWRRCSGGLKERWGKLIRNNSTVIRGKRDQLIGTIQERYGIANKDVEAQVDQFVLSLLSTPKVREANISLANREQGRRASKS
ncbi:MAG: CsbD family protein [Candidatus Acidiferrum sp.]